jgi:hypothetical protein
MPGGARLRVGVDRIGGPSGERGRVRPHPGVVPLWWGHGLGRRGRVA